MNKLNLLSLSGGVVMLLNSSAKAMNTEIDAIHEINIFNETKICTDQWFQTIEEKIQTGDSDGHGPDIGSNEWKSVVESKLGIRGEEIVPHKETKAWCEFIQRQMIK